MTEQVIPERRSSPDIGRGLFTLMVSMTMALSALGIDLMLPAFGAMRAEFGLAADSSEVASVVTVYFLGLAAGQLIYGPLADRYGRKPTLYLGIGIYTLAALASALAPGLAFLLVARFVWGVGAAGARVVSLAAVRDRYEGEEMAKAMSVIMAVFILVPVVAPTIGAAIVAVADWRWVFGFCVIYAVVLGVGLLRLPESLAREDRMEASLERILRAAREVVTNRQTLGYTLAQTALFGVLTSYLGSLELIISDVFGLGDQFPLIFGALASVIGVAMLANSRLVGAYGVRRLVHAVLIGYAAAGSVLVWVTISADGHPAFGAFAAALAAVLVFHGLLIPNMNTIAMDPMGRIAGMASAVTGTISMALGAFLGSVVDRLYDGSVTPMSVGFLAFGLIAGLFVVWAERGVMFRPLRA